ncbi:Pam17-domain-containing protein [Microthyrium microscopicum]|uniref:Presequence translocated-associated motor subunit PAM17 n=1 Tax=Microthyrium microscopicum TaxID=703497 RepID=A0A6A6UI52_9PEZI|nr:Pam17-domain-containing protein [Microthyrium microscopicum]
MICARLPVASLPCQSLRPTTTTISLPTLSLRLPIRQHSTLPIRRTALIAPAPKYTANPSLRLLTRNASTAAAAPGALSAGSAPVESLTWNRFLQLRKTRRRINVIASVLGIGACVAGSMYAITIHEVETLASQVVGLDPLITMGIIVVATAASGWLIGPIFGNALFNLRYRALRVPIMEKEKEFFQRIRKHRVDPTRSSYQNPVPDYYGEKIGSVSDYRRWLKDQRAFNLKREKMIV